MVFDISQADCNYATRVEFKLMTNKARVTNEFKIKLISKLFLSIENGKQDKLFEVVERTMKRNNCKLFEVAQTQQKEFESSFDFQIINQKSSK